MAFKAEKKDLRRIFLYGELSIKLLAGYTQHNRLIGYIDYM